MSRAIYVFGNDLRLTDNLDLTRACDGVDQVIPVVIQATVRNTATAADWWRGQSLKALCDQFAELGSRLVVTTDEQLDHLAKHLNAAHIYKAQSSNLIHDPKTILKADGAPYRVFTPFYRQWRARLDETLSRPLPAPSKLAFAPKSELDELCGKLDTPEPHWSHRLFDHWQGQPGESGAQAQLVTFLDNHIRTYKADRDMLTKTATSQLSASLRHGDISPRQIIYASHLAAPDDSTNEPFIRQIAWREFAAYVLHHFPHTATQSMKPAFENFPWRDGLEADHDFDQWCKGQTGQDLVDAAMQELWQTGTMHNRARMITASYLTKNLGIAWQRGAGWFAHTLVDADTANNSLGWQWVAGCGTDAAPYFRIFNPATQASKFDPDGTYRARWLGPGWQSRSVTPLVDLRISRAQALARYDDMKAA
ncbi:MAG: deoxyribodipyrimidine photo-lyase [Alphaproteobacteria bacterium]